MSSEWYLMKPPHVQLSGFEGDALDEFGAEGFLEALESSVALDVELYNYDLSECQSIRAILNNRLTDTKLKTLVRHLLVPVGTCKAGMYAKVKGRFWIITGIVDDNGVYEKAILQICNYLLTWLDDDGTPLQRWANIESASQYNNGEHANDTLIIRSDQLMITIPNDEKSMMIMQNMRFVVDNRCRIYERQIEEGVTRDTSFPLITYDVTRIDSVLYDYQDSGLFEFMVTQDEQHDTDGYYVIDGKGYWLCYEPPVDNPVVPGTCDILCEDTTVYYDLEPAVFLARFYDSEGNVVNNIVPVWNLEGDLKELLDVTQIGVDLSIEANNRKLLNRSFELSLSADGYDTKTISISVKAFL
jgi:hypothetical protein